MDTSCTLSTDLRLRPSERSHHDRQSYHVYVIQGRGQRDYSDCQAALAHVPARMTALPFLGTEDEVIAKTRDADALVTSASPVTRSVMSALEGLKVVARTGWATTPSRA